MADLPELIVEIGFSAALTGTALHMDDSARGILDTATLAADDLMVDVSEYVTAVTTRRGATRTQDPVVRYDAGSATITFRNDDRRFDPTNLSGPYVAAGVTQVKPMRAVRIRATWNNVTYPVWRGFTDQWSVGYDGPNSSWAQVTCFDAFGVFAAHNRAAVSAVGSGELTSARINRVLDGIGWLSSDRAVSTGVEAVQSTTLDGSALSELQLTADTELGALFVDASGRVTFRPRSAPYTLKRAISAQAHFGDQPVDGVATTINLATNPSAETVLDGWDEGGTPGFAPTFTQSSTRAMFGTYSLLATWATATPAHFPLVQYTASGLTVGRTYTISVYAYVPTGSPYVALFVPVIDHWGDGTFSLKDQWVRLTWTGTANSATLLVQLWPENSTTTAGQQVWIDGLQIEEGTSASDYTDGDQTGCEWDGIAHASTSRRLPELPYQDASLVYDALTITNHVVAGREGGTTQSATDSASVSAYLTRSHSRTDLTMQTDAEALMWGEQIVARTANPQLRFASVTLSPTRDDRLWPQALSREITERVRATRRPPGGGDAIERDCWVRGIEHRVTAQQDWQTVFVLEQALDQETVTDTFTRTASSGWGSADTGQAWTTTGGSASDYAVSSGTGRHTLTSASVLRSSYVEVGLADQVLSYDVTVPVVPTGASITIWLAGRVTDASNHYIAQLVITTSGSTTLALFRRVSGALSGSLASASGATHSAGNTWRIQLHCLGTTVRGRAWRPGTDLEPSYTSVTDSNLTTGTQAGVLSRRESGNTNSNPVLQFDSFSAEGRRWWD